MSKINSQLLKGIYPTLILKLLKGNTEMYGYQIEKNMRVLSDNAISITEGSLYPILHKLEEQGIIKSKVRTVKNRPRKYYSITKKGLSEFDSRKSEMVGLFDYVSKFLTQR